MYSLALSMPPAHEPVTLDEARQHRKVDYDLTEDDELIEAIMAAAREHAEARTGRRLVTQTWSVFFDSFGSHGRDSIQIPISQLQSVAFVKYYDEENVLQTMDPALYECSVRALRPRIQPVAGQVWPATYDRIEGVEISVVAGYGVRDEQGVWTPQPVPRAICQWILCMIAECDEHRIMTTERGQLLVNPFIDGLLDPYRIVEI